MNRHTRHSERCRWPLGPLGAALLLWPTALAGGGEPPAATRPASAPSDTGPALHATMDLRAQGQEPLYLLAAEPCRSRRDLWPQGQRLRDAAHRNV